MTPSDLPCAYISAPCSTTSWPGDCPWLSLLSLPGRPSSTSPSSTGRYAPSSTATPVQHARHGRHPGPHRRRPRCLCANNVEVVGWSRNGRIRCAECADRLTVRAGPWQPWRGQRQPPHRRLHPATGRPPIPHMLKVRSASTSCWPSTNPEDISLISHTVDGCAFHDPLQGHCCRTTDEPAESPRPAPYKKDVDNLLRYGQRLPASP